MNHLVMRLRRPIVVAAAAATMLAIVPSTDAQAAGVPGFESGEAYLTSLLGEYGTYWTAPGEPYDGTGVGGAVTETGEAVLRRNDETIVAINNKAAADADQTARALADRDADKNVAFAFKDGFGPIIGKYFEEGYNDGSLELVANVMNGNGWSANPAKEVYQYPRPYTERTTWLPNADYSTDGTNDMGTLSDVLTISKVADGLGNDGATHSADYPKNYTEGSFPSGHTNKAYSRAVTLATMVPELAPEILARASEAGNNRIALGVHYPLDVMAGRIGGAASNAACFEANGDTVDAARTQLRDYLTRRCQQDGHGDTLAECIVNTGADDENGYRNTFTDVVSTEPVTDRASAIAAYTARMTYGFEQVNAAGQPFVAPDGATELLRYAYPDLNDAQREAVLAATAIDSGYPLDSSSEGWQRINLARALSSKVTLDGNGTVTKVEDADAPEVVTASDTTVTVFGITDFHGHIENGPYLATALNEVREQNPNTVFVGAGDLVGASAYASSLQNDEPAMEQLKAMGLAVSTTGNHEFDKGASDLVDRIMPGVSPAQYVVSNVTGGALDGAVQPYAIVEVGGKRVAFIGGVYDDLLGSVSPAGMQGVTVSDPIEAINRYADQLSDGDTSNGEADAVVALAHTDANSLTALNANVDAVFAGHTHLDQATSTASGAPILQAANYGTAFATVDLTIGTDGAVTAGDSGVHSVFAEDGETPLYDPEPETQGIYDAANAQAQEIGKRQLGTVAEGSVFNRGSDKPGDVTGNGNNRGVESTLGHLQGDVTLWAANYSMGEGAADIGVINPGGLRADLDPNGDGIVTYQEAHDVLPFGNTNAVVTLTGAQLKTMFEQQWQPAGEDRPVLWLGVSSNVTYKYETTTETVDGVDVPRGHVFDLRVNGKEVKDDDTFKVAGNSFLLAGGDNFTVFQEGADYVDTGFVDLDGFVEYLKANPNIVAPKTRLSAGFSNIKLDGDTLSFDVTGLSYTAGEAAPKAIDLHVNGVDFGVVEGVDAGNYQDASNGPGAGWVRVTKTLTADERAQLVDAASGAVDLRNAEVVSLFTDAEIQAAKDSRNPGSGEGSEVVPGDTSGDETGDGDQPGADRPDKKPQADGQQSGGKTPGKLSQTGSAVALVAVGAVLAAVGATVIVVRRQRQR